MSAAPLSLSGQLKDGRAYFALPGVLTLQQYGVQVQGAVAAIMRERQFQVETDEKGQMSARFVYGIWATQAAADAKLAPLVCRSVTVQVDPKVVSVLQDGVAQAVGADLSALTAEAPPLAQL